MALIVEDGTGLETAESNCSVAFVDKYFTDRGVALWAVVDATRKEQLLRVATEYIETRYAERFRGVRLNTTQALSFPRSTGGVPTNLQRATAEYALRANVAPLIADPVTDSTGMRLKSKTEKLGPLEEKTEYADVSASVFKPYPAADMLLKSLLRPAGLIR